MSPEVRVHDCGEPRDDVVSHATVDVFLSCDDGMWELRQGDDRILVPTEAMEAFVGAIIREADRIGTALGSAVSGPTAWESRAGCRFDD